MWPVSIVYGVVKNFLGVTVRGSHKALTMATPTRGLVIAGSQNGVGSKYAAEDFANIPSLYILRKG